MLERQQTELSDLLNQPETYRERADEVAKLSADLAAVEKAVEGAYERWAELEALED